MWDILQAISYCCAIENAWKIWPIKIDLARLTKYLNWSENGQPIYQYSLTSQYTQISACIMRKLSNSPKFILLQEKFNGVTCSN